MRLGVFGGLLVHEVSNIAGVEFVFGTEKKFCGTCGDCFKCCERGLLRPALVDPEEKITLRRANRQGVHQDSRLRSPPTKPLFRAG